MRPEGRGEHQSLYFQYPHFDPPHDRDRLTDRSAVAIVGAGPIGMLAALTFAKYGIRCVLFDNKATFNDGSRAICIARQSMHILESLGVVDPFVQKSLHYLSGRSFYRGQQILEFHMPDSADQKYRPMHNLQQQYIEAYLYDGVARSKLIDMRWQSEVEAVADIDGGVRLAVKDPLGNYTMEADWLLAADGARSAIRALRGYRLKGQNYEGRYVIADIQMRFEHKVERWALFDPPSRPGGTVLVHQQPENIWRIDYQLRDGESEQEALREHSIREGVASVLKDCGIDTPWELEWWSIYSANTLALDDYRDGRIFFVGDSAHIVPIFGVRGLNNGLADAQNIGWKLAWMLAGKADPSILDSYTPERRGATMEVFANAGKSARFMTPQSRGWSLMRDAALSLALRHPFAGEFANPRNMTPHTYADSSLTTTDTEQFEAGPIPGAVAFNIKQPDGFLSNRFGSGFTVLAFGKITGLSTGPELTIVELPIDGPEARLYGATEGSAYLLRPDHHIAARWRRATSAVIKAALDRSLGRPSGSR